MFPRVSSCSDSFALCVWVLPLSLEVRVWGWLSSWCNRGRFCAQELFAIRRWGLWATSSPCVGTTNQNQHLMWSSLPVQGVRCAYRSLAWHSKSNLIGELKTTKKRKKRGKHINCCKLNFIWKKKEKNQYSCCYPISLQIVCSSNIARCYKNSL